MYAGGFREKGLVPVSDAGREMEIQRKGASAMTEHRAGVVEDAAGAIEVERFGGALHVYRAWCGACDWLGSYAGHKTEEAALKEAEEHVRRARAPRPEHAGTNRDPHE